MTAPVADAERDERARLLYTAPLVAEQLSVSVRTVWDLIATGQLATVRIGRRVLVQHDELTRFVEALAEAN